MNFGTYAVNVVWNPPGTTAYDALPAPNGPLRVTITRGRSSDLGPVQRGACAMLVQDQDGLLNPTNAASPLVSAGYLRPMRKLTVTVTPTGAGSPTPIFTGFLSRVWAEPDATVRTAELEFVDGFWLLEHAFPTVAPTGAIRAGAALAALLTAAGIAGGDTDLDAGGWLPDFSTDGTRSALAVAQDVELIDQGVFFYSAAGKHTYRDRSARYGRSRATPTITLAGTGVSAQAPGFDVGTVVNEQTVQVQRRVETVNPDATVTTSLADLGAPQTVTDTSYLGVLQAGAPIASTYLRDETQANSLAQHLVRAKKSGDVPVRDVVVPGLSLAQVTQQVALELSTPVTLSGLGVASEGLVESVRHEITRAQHATTIAVSSRPGYGFTIGVSTIGGSDVLMY